MFIVDLQPFTVDIFDTPSDSNVIEKIFQMLYNTNFELCASVIGYFIKNKIAEMCSRQTQFEDLSNQNTIAIPNKPIKFRERYPCHGSKCKSKRNLLEYYHMVD